MSSCSWVTQACVASTAGSHASVGIGWCVLTPYETRTAESLHYTILNYTILYYTILCYTTLHYTTLYYTILHYTILYYTIQYSTLLYSTLLYSTILYVYAMIPYYTISTRLYTNMILKPKPKLLQSCLTGKTPGAPSGLKGPYRTKRKFGNIKHVLKIGTGPA